MIPRPVIALGKSCPNNHRAEDLGQPGAISHPSPTRRSTRLRYACCFAIAAAVLAGATAARADGVPGLRGHDHTGITVPDIKQAADFFINVLGCKEAMSFGPFADEKGNFMADRSTSIRGR
jgi:hypothetical protein